MIGVRNGDWVQTLSGGKFWPIDPRPEDVCIEDIAWALSMQCRYAGHVKYFYSVAQHSVYVSQYCDPEDALAGLLHDASEAYIQDIIRPVKIHLPDYKIIEERFDRCIAERFNLPYPMPANVKRADEMVFAAEVRDIRPTKHGSIWSSQPPPVGFTIRPMSIDEARGRFLERFAAVSNKPEQTWLIEKMDELRKASGEEGCSHTIHTME